MGNGVDNNKLPKRVKDITGKVIGKYTVLSYQGINNTTRKDHLWLCKCSCGRIKTLTKNRLGANKIGCGSCLNNVIEKEDYLVVDVSTATYPNVTTKVDKKFAYLFTEIRWFVVARHNNKNALYVTTNSNLYGSKSLHRVINDTPAGKETDHISGETLDNRCVNLRAVDTQSNQRNCATSKNNSSGSVGVGLTPKGRWRAYIFVNYKQIHLGHYDEYEDAVEARKQAEVKYGFHENHGRLATNLQQTKGK